jgi:hypothetical protein
MNQHFLPAIGARFRTAFFTASSYVCESNVAIGAITELPKVRQIHTALGDVNAAWSGEYH